MYTPRHFVGSDAQAFQLIRDNAFATLITTVDGAAPHITHLPLLLEDGVLAGHLARANPHWQVLAQGHTVAVFHGPHSYISPRWYVEPDQNVPTWNYAVAHVHGQPLVLDAALLPAHITALTEQFEQGAWTARPEKLQQLVPGVVGLRMPIARIEMKIKMSQNRTAADRAKVIAALRASGRAEDAAVAEWIVVDE